MALSFSGSKILEASNSRHHSVYTQHGEVCTNTADTPEVKVLMPRCSTGKRLSTATMKGAGEVAGMPGFISGSFMLAAQSWADNLHSVCMGLLACDIVMTKTMTTMMVVMVMIPTLSGWGEDYTGDAHLLRTVLAAPSIEVLAIISIRRCPNINMGLKFLAVLSENNLSVHIVKNFSLPYID